MSHNSDDARREALRQRQGKGARFDAASAPHGDLLLARRGTAFFARKLMELSDIDLYLGSIAEGHSRARIVAEISLSARRQALMLEALLDDKPAMLPRDLEQQFSDLDLAETLPPQAIRHLFRHSQVHLNVCWRDLSDDQWDQPLSNPDGSLVTPRHLPRARAVQIWQAAIDLANGASSRDLPDGLK